MVLIIFKIALRLRDQHTFMLQSLEILTVHYFTFLTYAFQKTKNILKNLEYRFLDKRTTIKNAIFAYMEFCNNYFIFF